MKSQRAFEKHSYAFSFLLLILFFVVTAQVWVVSLVYIVLFTGDGLYLMRRKGPPDPQVAVVGDRY